jgi:hypothetical protein
LNFGVASEVQNGGERAYKEFFVLIFVSQGKISMQKTPLIYYFELEIRSDFPSLNAIGRS